jgi:hypothetical protein
LWHLNLANFNRMQCSPFQAAAAACDAAASPPARRTLTMAETKLRSPSLRLIFQLLAVFMALPMKYFHRWLFVQKLRV